MPVNKTEIFLPGAYYHIYNRSNAKELLFVTDDNYRFFLQKYKNYVSPFIDTLAYCLMPNHFHFIINIKDTSELQQLISGFNNLTELEIHKKISLRFSHFFNSYTKAFNNMYGRSGNLFSRQFKRKRITSVEYMKKLILYIHNNPVEAVYCINPEDWKYSSYLELISEKSLLINENKKSEVVSWFDDLINFEYCHRLPKTC